MNPLPTLDRSVLDQLHEALGYDATVLCKIIDSYLDGLADRVAAIRAAVGDPGKLGRVAHALASPSATLGVRSIAEPCLAIERAVDEGQARSPEVEHLVESVVGAVDQVRLDLDGWLDTWRN